MAGTLGHVKLWKPIAPKGAYAFVKLKSGKEVYAPAKNFSGVHVENITEGMKVEVFGIKPSKGKRDYASRVEFRKDED